MAKEIKETPVEDQNPQGGGSYIRNPDGTLSQTEGPSLTNQPADEAADEAKE